MRKKMLLSVAMAGLMTVPASAAWPSFTGTKSKPAPTGQSTGWFGASSPASESAPAAEIPSYHPPGAQPETRTQKLARKMNPLNWIGSEKKDPAPVADPISLATPTGPASPLLRISLAQMAESQGKLEEARKQMEEALAQSPNDPVVLREYARMEDRAGRMAEAEQLYGRAMAINPKDAAARNDLGLCLARSGKLSESAHVLRTAVALKPEKALYRNNLATVLVEMGDSQAAFDELSAVHEPATAHFNMGQLFAQRGRMEEATRCYHLALQVDPTMQAAQAALARTQQAGNVQVASRPATQPAQMPAETSPVIPETPDTQPIGPAFPVPRNLPSVQ